jgi:cobalt-zinc-cadmium efflux system outer membrane protein
MQLWSSIVEQRSVSQLSNADCLQDLSIDEQQILASSRQNNPGLKSLASQVDMQRHSQRLAGKQGRPDFSLGASWIITGEALNPQTPDSGKDPILAQVAISLPLWRGRYSATNRDAAARLRAVSFEQVDYQQQLEANVKQQTFALRDAQRRVRLYRDTLVPKGNQSLRATSTAFQSGRVEFLSLIDALRVLLEFELNLERARAEQLTTRGELEMLMGTSLPLAHNDATNQ